MTGLELQFDPMLEGLEPTRIECVKKIHIFVRYMRDAFFFVCFLLLLLFLSGIHVTHLRWFSF